MAQLMPSDDRTSADGISHRVGVVTEGIFDMLAEPPANSEEAQSFQSLLQQVRDVLDSLLIVSTLLFSLVAGFPGSLDKGALEAADMDFCSIYSYNATQCGILRQNSKTPSGAFVNGTSSAFLFLIIAMYLQVTTAVALAILPASRPRLTVVVFVPGLIFSVVLMVLGTVQLVGAFTQLMMAITPPDLQRAILDRDWSSTTLGFLPALPASGMLLCYAFLALLRRWRRRRPLVSTPIVHGARAEDRTAKGGQWSSPDAQRQIMALHEQLAHLHLQLAKGAVMAPLPALEMEPV